MASVAAGGMQGTVSADSESCEHRLPKVRIISGIPRLGRLVVNHLASNDRTAAEYVFGEPHTKSTTALEPVDILVYIPRVLETGMVPDLPEADLVLRKHCHAGATLCVLVSSAAIYDASFRNPGLLSESHPLRSSNRTISNHWMKLESIAATYFKPDHRLVVLRCATILSREAPNAVARFFRGRTTIVIPGHDPSVQLMGPVDLAQAIQCILQKKVRGLFNVAPNDVIPLRAALRWSGIQYIPVPRTILRAAHRALTGKAANHLDYARYSWTISNDKIRQLGFVPRSSLDTLADFLGKSAPESAAAALHRFDEFGMDKEYIGSYGRTLFRFLADWYWRIEVKGISQIPSEGRGLLTGVHRGFMPWDGVMALHLIARGIGRYPRFLIHPGLIKFPFLANFMTKLGGIVACRQNAARILERDELLGIFPEGIQAAFAHYSHAYQIQEFHRDSFVKIALRHRAPIIPFVTVGSAEIFPILGKMKSRRWTKYSEWPAFPITPTFPLIPLPLPSKWHTSFLPAMHIEEDYPPSAATNNRTVRAISDEVKRRMQKEMDDMRRRRNSIFFGSIFTADG
jgi:1-acyl-sn-glycerol-3-phosphate acyltransferase